MINKHLLSISQLARENIRQNKKNLFVFDLDSTLFDVSKRSQQIVIDFSLDVLHRKQFPRETELLKSIKIEQTDWGIRESVERLPFAHHPPQEFYVQLKNYWMERFFDSSYLHHDEPYPGAVEFVSELAISHLNSIVYLTGRDIKRMLLGTEASLRSHNFPLDKKNVSLALKPDTHISDTDFKCGWFKNIELLEYQNIWLFENEPVNIEKVASEHPKVEFIFFDSTHSGKLASPTHYPIITNYL